MLTLKPHKLGMFYVKDICDHLFFDYANGFHAFEQLEDSKELF